MATFYDFKRIKFDRQYPASFAFSSNIDSFFLLNPADYPEISDLINNLKQWNRNSDIENIGAATFLEIYQVIYTAHRSYLRNKIITKEEAASILKEAKASMLKDFGRTNLQLGDIQKLVRGEKEFPLGGLPDVLAPSYSIPYKNGMVKDNQGDAYIELVRFTKTGPVIESLNVYGASARKDSPHYTDQMEMFTYQQTKSMTLNKEEVYKHAEKIYHPN